MRGCLSAAFIDSLRRWARGLSSLTSSSWPDGEASAVVGHLRVAGEG